jgi:F0F1-type ATP synthase membrane subunit c/vacuolar-type H+-ATPase subunit K
MRVGRNKAEIIGARSGALAAFLAILVVALGAVVPGFAQAGAAGGGPSATAQEPDSQELPSDMADMLADAEELGFSYEIYQVGKGDTVENIAVRFGVSADLIRQFNELSSGELTIGQSLAVLIPVTPSKRSPEMALAQTPLNIIEPRYAMVTGASQITSEPLDVGPADLLYTMQAGSRVIVDAEQGDYWGVVMIDGSVGWIPKSAVQLTDQKLSAEQLETMLKGGRLDIVQEAYRYLGTPYCYGGHLPYNVDCSLLVQTAHAARGIKLPRTAAAQFEVGRSVGLSELVPGDRLYFVSRSGRINHTGIYIGNGRFIHASSRRGCVAVDSLYTRMYWTRFVGARRS